MNTLPDFEQILPVADLGAAGGLADAQWLVADLHDAGWQPYAVYHRLAALLGLPPWGETVYPSLQLAAGRLTENRPSDDSLSQVARLIDRENEGNQYAMIADRQARQLAEALACSPCRRLLVLPPEPGQWSAGDVWLLYFLARRLPAEGIGIHRPAPAMPLPTTAPAAVPAASHVAELQFWRHCREQALRNGSVNLQLMCEAADRAFQLGDVDVALRYLRRALAEASGPETHAELQCAVQAILIAAMRFGEAAEIDIAPGLPLPLAANLSMSKGWGLVMQNRPQEAESYFAGARRYYAEAGPPFLYCYLLNISSLNQVKLGNLDQAFQWELQINALLEAMGAGAYQLRYVNQINIARLLKMAKRYDEAELCYARAFALNQGVKTDSDFIYFDLCRAQLRELQGRAEEARTYWLRVALYWLSMPLPESIAPRTVSAILLGRPAPLDTLVEQISEQLLRKLADGEQPEAPETAGILAFARSDASPRTAVGSAPAVVGNDGWAVLSQLGNPLGNQSGPLRHSAMDRLARAVARLLAQRQPNWDFSRPQTLYVDTNLGCDMVGTEADALELGLRLQAGTVLFGNARHDLSPQWQVAARSRVKIGFSAAVNDLVRSQERVAVCFRRYRPPLLLESDEARIVADLANGQPPSLAQGQSDGGQTLQLLRRLEQKRVLRLALA